jgi:hypothetical protein
MYITFLIRYSGEKMRVQWDNTSTAYRFRRIVHLLTESGIPMNLVRLIKIYLNYSKVHTHMHARTWHNFYSKYSETRRCFIAITLEYIFRKVHENQEGLELDTSASGLYWCSLGKNINTKENTESLLGATKEFGLEVMQSKANTCPYLIITRMQGKIKIYG